jgi:fructokinase
VAAVTRPAIGIDLGGTKIEGLLLDEGVERRRVRVPTPRDDYDATVRAIVSLVQGLDGLAGGPATVGIGIPGSLEPSTALVKNANSTWLLGRPLRHDLERALTRPVAVANDANCFALSEATDGAAAGAAVVFGVILGTGVGGGLVVHGRTLDGPNGVAGEWGHNQLPWMEPSESPGPRCYCGRHGCVETFLSGPALAADHARVTGDETVAESIAAQAAAGDGQAMATFDRYVSRAARALASVINVIDPDVIVLGGGLSNVDALYTRVPERWGTFVFACDAAVRQGGEVGERLPVRTMLRRARHGDSSGVRGAAWLGAVQ